MAELRFLDEFDPCYGQCVEVAPGIRRVVARNPSKFTAWGTGTYIVGRGEVAVIDPGPDLAEHVEAVLDAVCGETVTHILVTHTHGDHSPAATALSAVTGAPTYGFGPHPVAAITADPDDDTPVEEHADLAFTPDVVVGHGDVIAGRDAWFQCLHTPGHISNHLCFAERTTGALFPGDHVMGWSTTIIPPPDGNLAQYLDSLRLLIGRDDAVYYPTHGPPITRPQPYVAALLEHRLERSRQIVAQLRLGPRTIDELVAVLYADVREELHKPAARTVHAHLLQLIDEGVVTAVDGHAGPDSSYRVARR